MPPGWDEATEELTISCEISSTHLKRCQPVRQIQDHRDFLRSYIVGAFEPHGPLVADPRLGVAGHRFSRGPGQNPSRSLTSSPNVLVLKTLAGGL